VLVWCVFMGFNADSLLLCPYGEASDVDLSVERNLGHQLVMSGRRTGAHAHIMAIVDSSVDQMLTSRRKYVMSNSLDNLRSELRRRIASTMSLR
jgi:hypothetical protein